MSKEEAPGNSRGLVYKQPGTIFLRSPKETRSMNNSFKMKNF